MQRQIGPVVVIILVVALVLFGWLYWRHLNSDQTPPDATTPATTMQPGGLPQPVRLKPEGTPLEPQKHAPKPSAVPSSLE